jgi:hypothetical protein
LPATAQDRFHDLTLQVSTYLITGNQRLNCVEKREKVMSNVKVYLGPVARNSTHNPDRLLKQAEAAATAIVLPQGIEFAKFEHAGKTYALSAKMVVEVEVLTTRVPDVVIRERPRPPEERRIVRKKPRHL